MIPLLISNIAAFISVVIMFVIVKTGYEQKDRMLRLFQFGYLGLLILNFLGQFVAIVYKYLEVRGSGHWTLLRYMTLVLNFSVLIPYLIHELRKNKVAKT